MKKLTLLILLSITILSCSKDDTIEPCLCNDYGSTTDGQTIYYQVCGDEVGDQNIIVEPLENRLIRARACASLNPWLNQ